MTTLFVSMMMMIDLEHGNGAVVIRARSPTTMVQVVAPATVWRALGPSPTAWIETLIPNSVAVAAS